MIIRRALAQDANELAEFNSSIARETEGIELIPEVITAGVKAMMEIRKWVFTWWLNSTTASRPR